MPGLFGEKVKALEAILFLGAAIAITAFPMLARIIYERGLTGTALGTLSLAAGAMGDDLVDLPMLVRCGFSAAGLPIGLQLIGRAWDEATLQGIGHAYERLATDASRAQSTSMATVRAILLSTWPSRTHRTRCRCSVCSV